MKKQTYLQYNQKIIQDKTVLDLACHTGESTGIISSLGAKHVYAVEIRQDLLDIAKNNVSGPVDFYQGDITDPAVILPFVGKCQTVILLGVFYHLFDHFRFLSHILGPKVEHCLIETVCGPESLNPEMFWGFERTDFKLNGYFGNHDRIPHGTPNTAWIIESAKIFGFDCDWIEQYGIRSPKSIYDVTLEEYTNIADPDWPPYQNIMLNKDVPSFVKNELDQMLCTYETPSRRMILRLYNTKIVDSRALDLEKIYQWKF